MATKNPYATYTNNKVLTASPAELILMLYEAAIKFTNVAIMSIEKNDIQKAHTNIMKTERIIEELMASLNHKYEVSKEFDKVYDYIMWRLRNANMKKDPEILEDVLTQLRTMRDAWKEVMKITQNGSTVRVS